MPYVDVVELKWSGPFRFQELYEEDYDYVMEEKGIYMVVGGRKILYISKTYDQDFISRLRQHTRDRLWLCVKRAMRKKRSKEPFFKVGELLDVASRSRIGNIESFLIWVEEPLCNKKSTLSYYGRDLEVRNFGNYWPLKELYATENYDV